MVYSVVVSTGATVGVLSVRHSGSGGISTVDSAASSSKT